MAISPEQSEKIKEQLIFQINNSQLENKEQIKEHIKNLNEEQLEEFLKQNNIQFQEGELQQTPQEKTSSCIFCSIIKDKIPSYKIAENTKAIAILELNPVSKGHSLILPLKHLQIEQLPKSALSLAQKIAKKIKTKLKPEDIKIETSSFQGHAFINIIPIYKDQKLEKHKAEESELKELQEILKTKKRGPRKTKIKTIKTQTDKLPKISFRIP